MKTPAPVNTNASVAQRLWAAPIWLSAAALCLGLAGLIAAALLTGLNQAGQISDPGAVTRWGLPTARWIHHLAMATAVSAAVLASITMPFQAGPRRRRTPASRQARGTAGTSRQAGASGAGSAEDQSLHPLYTGVLQIALAAGAVWTVAAVAVLILTFSAVAGLPVTGEASFAAGLGDFITSIATGQAWLTVVVLAGLFTTLIAVVRPLGAVAFTAVVGLSAIVPMALVGHSSSGDDHTAAVNSLGLHLLGVVLWVGGLIVLLLMSPKIRAAVAHGSPEDSSLLGTLLRRYSLLAGLALVTVVASGVINASLRITSVSDLFGTAYGQLLVVKLAATAVLAGIGWTHRNWIIPRLTSTGQYSTSRLLWQLVVVEVAIMSAVLGLSAVLGRTAPPAPQELPPDASPARMLTGHALPPEPSLALYFTQWRPDWLWIAVVAFLALWYLTAQWRLRRKGTPWPVMRTVSWLFGLFILNWVTSGGAAIYGMVVFSGHMVQHMTLTMVAPIFLVMGSPVTLALRALPVRQDGTRGAREWIIWLVHSRWSRFITHPVVAAVNFGGSILLFYYTPIFGWSMQFHLGHVFMTVHFLLTGYIFALVLIGRDPLPSRPPHFLRLIILLATMVFHAFLAVVITGSEQLLEAEWFGVMGHGWFPALHDQRTGGELMWGLGEIPAVIMGIVVAVQWSRDDSRETKRLDREADRTGEADLEAYNQMFADMAERGPTRR